MKELQSFKLVLNDGQSVRKVEANLGVASFIKGSGNIAKRNKTESFRPPKVERKRTKKPKYVYKSNYFFYDKKGHFKANYKEWKGYLANKGNV
ncbi:hypothetical protein J1N35_007458 [Gossypium stocksii]|uniref:Uncharacterized protein n=1 Tax=Gossypium stocksii TaxID=47602 RepID=A0A9D3W8H2_9ROSI|nr:hypothetical protein J1N35_007458 [Gossypium stocksii]